MVGIPPGENIQVFSDGTNIDFVGLERIGTYIDYAGSAQPAWLGACTVPPYLPCLGQTFSAVTYPALAAIMGGTTLPDSRSRVRIPLDAGSGRVTTAGSGIDGTTRFSAGGAQNVTLDVTMIPPITPTGAIGGSQDISTDRVNGGAGGSGCKALRFGTSEDFTVVFGANFTFTGNQFGGGLPHENMQPSYVGGITMIRAG